MTAMTKIEGGKVRLSDADLHRAACKAIYEGNHIVFESLPTIVRQIIEHKTWRTYQKTNFADYALDETTNGLGVNSNQRLWMLRCAMDAHGRHIHEWAGVLAKVEQMVRLEAASDGRTIRSFQGNSLEMLAKNVSDVANGKILYLPSMAGESADRHVMNLRKSKPDMFKRVIRGEMTLVEARKAAGMAVAKQTNLGRAQSAVRQMSKSERKEFIEWLKSEGLI